MREMKDSGIPWVGQIPDDWNIKRGKFVLKLLNRPVLDTDEVITCFRDGEVTLRRNRREDGFTISLKEIGYQGLEPGDLVIHGMDGFAGSIGISDSRGKASPVLVVCDSDENKRYIMYYLRAMAYNDVFTALATGIRVRSCDLRWNKLSELPYILPSIQEQEQVVEAIESCTQNVNALIANVQTQIETLKAYKTSIISEAVTLGLNPSVSYKDSGIQWASEIPDTWDNRKMISILSMRVVDGPHESPVLQNEGIPYISATAIENGKINFDLMRGYISEEYCNLCDMRYKPQLHDILVIKLGASTGQVAIVETEERFNIWVPLAAVRCNNEADPYFVYYAFQSDYFKRQMELLWTYGTQQTLGVKTIERLRILLPPLAEQKEIVAYLDDKREQIDRLIAIKQAKIEKLEQYKRSLIYEYVTGKKEVTA